LKLDSTHQILVYVDVNILGRRIPSIKKNTEALFVAIKDTGLAVNADKLSTWSCLEIRMREKIQIFEIFR